MYNNNFDQGGREAGSPLPGYTEQYPLQHTNFSNEPPMERGPQSYNDFDTTQQPLLGSPNSPNGPRSPFSRVAGGGGGVQFIEQPPPPPMSPGSPYYGEAPRRQPRRYKTGTEWLEKHIYIYINIY